MKKILVSAYGCEPLRGSEAGVGWNWVLQMARFHEVWVITRSNNRKAIEAHLPGPVKGRIHFFYYDACPLIRKLKHREKGLYFYYFVWQIGIMKLAKQLAQEIPFDYAVHLTFGSMWMPTFLPLLHIPFIWGPIGGADGVPRGYLKSLPWKQRILQSLRWLLVRTAAVNPLVVLPGKAAAAILCRTQNNREAIPSPYRDKCHVVLETAMETDLFLEPKKESRERGGVVEILSAGRLVPFKNTAMGVEIVRRVIRDGYAVRYTIIGDGPERKHIEALIEKEGLQGQVRLLGWLPRQEVLEQLREADLFLFPSLREGGTWALMEAMASGLPVVCFDWTGMGEITDDGCAGRVIPDNPSRDTDLFVKALEDLIVHPEKRRAYGENARRRIKTEFTWEKKAERFNQILGEIKQEGENG